MSHSAHDAPAAAPAAEAKVEKPSQPSALKMALLEFKTALIVGPAPRRRMAILLVVGLLGSLGVIGVGTARYIRFARVAAEKARRHAQGADDCKELKCTFNKLEDLAKQKAALAEIRDATVALGDFEVTLVGLGNGQKEVKLELDVAVEFDSAETGRWVAANKSPVRSEVLGAAATLTGFTREDLLTPEGKARVRERIRDRLDQWLPSGKVKGIYFSRFLLP